MSICVPTFNRADRVMRAVESSLNQTYPTLEVVVVDDASSDDTLARLQTVDDPRLRLHRNGRRLGQVRNRNRSIELARGEFVKFLDSDDTLEPECVSAMLGAIRSDASVGLVFSRRRLMTDGAPNRAERDWMAAYGNVHASIPHLAAVNGGPDVLRSWLAAGAHANWIGEPSAVMARREVLLAAGGFDPHTPLTCDIGLWMRILARTDAAFIDAELVRYRVGIAADSATADGLAGGRSWLERLWIIEALAADPTILSSFPELGPVLRGARREALRTVLKAAVRRGGFPVGPYRPYVATRLRSRLTGSMRVAELDAAGDA